MKIFGIITGAVFLVGLLFVGVNWWAYANKGVDLEEGIRAQIEQNKNKYSEFTSTAVESMGVAEQYQTAVKDVIIAGIEGRFGPDGSKSLVQAFSEAYPATLDSAMFVKVQQVIESGRRDFANEQKMLIGKVQVYRTELRKPWSKMWLEFAGFPTIDLSEPQYSPVVSGATRETFETGVDKGISF